MKKFISLVLALVMALSLTTVAWGASATTAVAETGGTTYDTLKEAYDAAAVGGTITLKKDVTDGDGLVISKSVVIDFGGYTYTVDSDPVGSAGTESQGFQILESAGAVTLKNGTLTSKAGSGVKMLVNNYCDLTLDGMTLIGTNLDGGGKYVLSNNAGDVVIEDTTITAAADGVAFDSYDYSAGGYTTPPTVTVKGTSVVNGKVEAAGGKLEVQSGTVNGDIDVVGDGQTSDVVVKGGTFTDDVSDYVADGVQQLPNGSVVPSSSIGDNTLSGNYFVKGTGAGAVASAAVVSVTDAKAPKDTDKDGLLDQVGNVKYFNIAGYTSKFVQVASVGEADMIVYYGNTDSVFAYLKAVASVEYLGTGVAFNNFGEKCGQYDDEPVAGTKYYLFQGVVYKTVTTSATNLMVGNTLTPVEAMADEFVDHAPAFTYDKDYKVVGVKCAKCGVPATLYANWAAIPKAAQADALALGDGRYYVWGAIGAAGTAGDKVESAETFDAGIAMYVGMSVMAAAGSAVVLKKKD